MALQDLLNPDFVAGLVKQNQQQPIPPSQTNEYGVPIVYTQPDVILRGRLEVEVRFKHADIQGKTGKHLEDLAFAVIMGNRGPGYPEVIPGLFQLWQEVVHSAPVEPKVVYNQPIDTTFSAEESERIIGQWLATLGRGSNGTRQDGLPQTGPTSDVGDVGNSLPGDTDHREQPRGGSPDRPIIPDQYPGPVTTPDDRYADAGSSPGPRLADKPRDSRARRAATEEEPRIPGPELGMGHESDDADE